jgi:hypothetical protein
LYFYQRFNYFMRKAFAPFFQLTNMQIYIYTFYCKKISHRTQFIFFLSTGWFTNKPEFVIIANILDKSNIQKWLIQGKLLPLKMCVYTKILTMPLVMATKEKWNYLIFFYYYFFFDTLILLLSYWSCSFKININPKCNWF